MWVRNILLRMVLQVLMLWCVHVWVILLKLRVLCSMSNARIRHFHMLKRLLQLLIDLLTIDHADCSTFIADNQNLSPLLLLASLAGTAYP